MDKTNSDERRYFPNTRQFKGYTNLLVIISRRSDPIRIPFNDYDELAKIEDSQLNGMRRAIVYTHNPNGLDSIFQAGLKTDLPTDTINIYPSRPHYERTLRALAKRNKVVSS